MQVKNALEVPAAPVEGTPGVMVRWLWAAPDGVPTSALRLFDVQPGAATPYHTHLYKHEIYVLSGQAKLHVEAQEHALGLEDTALILPD
jgi:quercetin dioxygenase-like cupin family protein